MKKRIIRRQPPVKGGRAPLPSCVLHETEQRVRALAERHRVSRSWVIAVILAKALGISNQVTYDE